MKISAERREDRAGQVLKIVKPGSAIPAGSLAETVSAVARQPIFDRHGNSVAYELLFRGSMNATCAGAIADNTVATCDVATGLYTDLERRRLVGDKQAFINVSDEFLESSAILALPRDGVVLELLESVAPSGRIVARCRQLVALGFRFALDDFVYRRELEPFMALASYIKFDVHALGAARTARQIHHVRGFGLKMVAEKIETAEEFAVYQALKFDYFQGRYLGWPETLSRVSFHGPQAVEGRPACPAC